MMIANGNSGTSEEIYCGVLCGSGCVGACEIINGDNQLIAGAISSVVIATVGIFVGNQISS